MRNLCCTNYVFIYKDANGVWNQATSLSFIAKHTHCRAIYISEVKKHFEDTKNMLRLINNNLSLSLAQEEVLKWNEIQ